MFEKSKCVVSPNDFAVGTQTTRIKKALSFIKERGGGTLELSVDTVTVPNTNVWTVSESIVLPSNTTLFLNNSKLKLGDGVFDTIIRNEGIVVDAVNPNGLACELRHNSNIKIIGSGIGTAFIEGPDIPFTAPHPVNGGEPIPWLGDFYGWRTVSILFANCSDYEIGGFSISKTTCWAISQEHGCENMHIHDIDFFTTVKNGDGIDFRKGCRDGLVENITGACSDDVIACTALLGHNNYPKGRYVFPLQVGGNEENALGNAVEDIRISNIRASSKCHVIICLAAGGAKVQDISASDIEDNLTFSAVNVVAVYTGYGKAANMGDIRNIHMKNIISNNAVVALKINTPLLDCTFEHIEQRRKDGVEYEISPPYESQMMNVKITDALGLNVYTVKF
jgi:polygalacturonase